MKYLSILLLALVVGCQTAPANGGAATGADSPRRAVDQFMTTMKSQDIQATAAIWGNERGPARDNLPQRETLERRVLIMQCYLAHDSYRVLSDTPAGARARSFRVSVTRGRTTRETSMRTVEGPGSRWYVETVDLEPLRDLCATGG